ncbi:calcium homeostasis modulator protein 6-like [Hemiscyllium ocellatum]|uniref:calcium homeostasis modulator protein 6-like n=1 Tax=Hemiscyllium ocellatum TaxID=170820 RepID=UPI002966C7F4|nr:calcium homeostasis modulator protein 6-like [Hemiscyllium ocellatum]
MAMLEKLQESFLNAKAGVFQVLVNFIVFLILYGVECQLDNEIQCPCHLPSNIRYISITFVFPAMSLFIVGLLVQSYLQKLCHLWWSKQKVEYRPPTPIPSLLTVCKASIPAILWIILLLLNGNYYACSKLIGRSETACESKCNGNSSEIVQDYCIASQFIGNLALVILLSALAIFYFLQSCSDWKSKYMFEYNCKCKKEEAKLLGEKLKAKAAEAVKEICKSKMSTQFPNDGQIQPGSSHENMEMNSQVP